MKKVIAYLLVVTSLSFVLRELIYVGMRKNTAGEFDKLNTIFIKKNNYNALIIGSSRAESHFVPSVIDSVTGLNCFNAGQSGAMQELNLAILKSYLVHSPPPKIIIVNIDIHFPSAGNDTIRYFAKYFAYIGNDTLYAHLKKTDKRFRYFKWIPFYSLPYTNDHYLSASLHGWLERSGENNNVYENGYTPEQIRIEDADKDSYPPINYTLDAHVYKSINAIINACKENNIQPVLVVSPLYYRVSETLLNKAISINLLKQLASQNNVVLIDYTDDEMCYKKEYFANPRHLNDRGAHIFSQKFANQLLQYLR